MILQREFEPLVPPVLTNKIAWLALSYFQCPKFGGVKEEEEKEKEKEKKEEKKKKSIWRPTLLSEGGG